MAGGALRVMPRLASLALAASDAAAAAASAAPKAKLASLGIARAAPPAMPREAWSGSPYSSPGRAAAASSKPLGTGPAWLS